MWFLAKYVRHQKQLRWPLLTAFFFSFSLSFSLIGIKFLSMEKVDFLTGKYSPPKREYSLTREKYLCWHISGKNIYVSPEF